MTQAQLDKNLKRLLSGAHDADADTGARKAKGIARVESALAAINKGWAAMLMKQQSLVEANMKLRERLKAK